MLENARIEFVKELGIKIDDLNFLKEKISLYGYHEIIDQYLELLRTKDRNGQPIWLHNGVSFREFYDIYQLDQQLKRIFMTAISMFEQSFKAAMWRNTFWAKSKFNVQQVLDQTKPDTQFLRPNYLFQNGRKINRGDLKARIRHIKRHAVEPYEDYNKLHDGKITEWVLVKNMSFGIVSNYFFLLPGRQQEKILAKVFKQKTSLFEMEKIVTELKLFNDRAAHNYRLLDYKVKNQLLYQLVANDLAKEINPDPVNYLKEKIPKIIAAFIKKYPQDECLVAGFEF